MAQLTVAQQFGRRLQQLRREMSAAEERDVEQAEVAKAVGDKQPNVAKWERGRLPRDHAVVRKLAGFYGVSYAWLLTGEGNRKPEAGLLPLSDRLTRKPTTAGRGAGGKRKDGAG